MNLLLITDTFPPLKGSGAVQFRDLANENLPARCKALFESNFAVANTVKQIMASVS